MVRDDAPALRNQRAALSQGWASWNPPDRTGLAECVLPRELAPLGPKDAGGPGDATNLLGASLTMMLRLGYWSTFWVLTSVAENECPIRGRC